MDILFIDDIADSESDRNEFRQAIADCSLDELETISSKVLSASNNKSGFLLQDIVNELGNRLGFYTESGRYRGIQDEIGYDGLWERKQTEDSSQLVVVETKTSDAHTINPRKQPGEYMREVQKKTDSSEVNGLIVLGKGTPDTVVDTVRGGVGSQSMRVVMLEDLFDLARLVTEQNLERAKVSQLILPLDTVYIGNLLSIFSRLLPTNQQDGQQKILSNEYLKKISTAKTPQQLFHTPHLKSVLKLC